IEKKKSAGIDFLLIENSTKIYDKLEKRGMKPLSVFDMIGRSLGPDLHITSLDVRPVVVATSLDPASETSQDPNAPEPIKQYEVVVRLILPAELAPEKGVEIIANLEKRLQANLPGHQVNIIKQVADMSYTGNFVGEATSAVNKDKEKQDYEAQIMIRGAML
ncbi:MAG: hypothetical protein DI551_11605, partial [Micavibrio aeruginosavorus]